MSNAKNTHHDDNTAGTIVSLSSCDSMDINELPPLTTLSSESENNSATGTPNVIVQYPEGQTDSKCDHDHFDNDAIVTDEDENELLISRMKKSFDNTIEAEMEEFNNVVAGPPSIQGLENKMHQLEFDLAEQQRQNATLRRDIAALKQTVEKQDKEKGKNLALHYQLEKSRFDLVNMMNEYNSLVESKVTTEADFNKRLRDVESHRAKIEKSLREEIDAERKEKKVVMSHLKESQRVIQKKNATIQKLEQRLLSLEGNTHPMSSGTECDLVDEIERLMEENIHKSTQIEMLEKTLDDMNKKLINEVQQKSYTTLEMNEWPSLAV